MEVPAGGWRHLNGIVRRHVCRPLPARVRRSRSVQHERVLLFLPGELGRLAIEELRLYVPVLANQRRRSLAWVRTVSGFRTALGIEQVGRCVLARRCQGTRFLSNAFSLTLVSTLSLARVRA